MDIIRDGRITFEHLIPKGIDGKAYNYVKQHIEHQGEVYKYEKWYNDKYVEEYLDNSNGELVYQKIHNSF